MIPGDSGSTLTSKPGLGVAHSTSTPDAENEIATVPPVREKVCVVAAGDVTLVVGAEVPDVGGGAVAVVVVWDVVGAAVVTCGVVVVVGAVAACGVLGDPEPWPTSLACALSPGALGGGEELVSVFSDVDVVGCGSLGVVSRSDSSLALSGIEVSSATEAGATT